MAYTLYALIALCFVGPDVLVIFLSRFVKMYLSKCMVFAVCCMRDTPSQNSPNVSQFIVHTLRPLAGVSNVFV
jgi:hypothetical protein